MARLLTQEHNWLPKDIGSLYLDKADHEGLIWWAEPIIKRIKQEQKGK